MKANNIKTIMNNLKNTEYKKILINGRWGVGKTKYVQDSLEEMQNDREINNQCYISLFGIKDVNYIIEEIYTQIVSKMPRKKYKVHLSKMRNVIKNLNLSYKNFSFSVPIMENLTKSVLKLLDKNEQCLIIIDDLERKQENLKINEVFGLVDKLSSVNGVKVVLICSKEQMKEEDQDDFNEYEEKSIDRIYTVTQPADNARVQILGEDVWNSIKNLVYYLEEKLVINKELGWDLTQYNLNNLRTFIKGSLFIHEVINTIERHKFSDKVTRGDVHRICFAIVIFIIEHKSQKLYSDPSNKTHTMIWSYSDSQYINQFLLNESLENENIGSLTPVILKWYKEGVPQIIEINNAIDSVNNFEKKQGVFYWSLEEIEKYIEKSENRLNNIKRSDSIKQLITAFGTIIQYSKILDLEINLKSEKVINNMQDNLQQEINLEVTLSTNINNILPISIYEDEETIKLINLVKKDIEKYYMKHLLDELIEYFQKNNYGNTKNLELFSECVHSIQYQETKNEVIKLIRANDYLFPMPVGNISDEQIDWSHAIKNLIRQIKNIWKIEDLYDEFKKYIIEKSKAGDKLLQFRVNKML